MRRLVLIAVVLAALLSPATSATAGTQPVTQCAAGANPCAGYQDNTTSQVVAITIWYDHAGAPIAEIANAGGLKVFGDDVTVYGPGSVTRPVVQLRPDGTILLGGQLITPRLVKFDRCLMEQGMTAAACRKVTP